MKILELTNYSAGICGVWTRVKEEATRLAELGHEVVIFSSNRVKGNDEIAPADDKIGKVKIKRFSAVKIGGESFLKWDFEKEALKLNPDIIIAHSYRHLHTTKALKIGSALGAKVFLVTHAPFIQGNKTRSFLASFAVNFYDKFIGSSTLKKFDKIIAITHWEIPYLVEQGVDKSNITYIPNGIPEQFFSQKKARENKKILFLGRISPIKSLETLIEAMSIIKDKKVILEVVGPIEKKYGEYLKNLIKTKKIDSRVIFSGAVYNINEKINKIDSAKIFVLPSKREAMPQALIEAMAREKIVIASDNPGSRDIISNKKNGFLFPVGDAKSLALRIDESLSKRLTNMKKEARNSVRQFHWDNIIKKIIKVIE